MLRFRLRIVIQIVCFWASESIGPTADNSGRGAQGRVGKGSPSLGIRGFFFGDWDGKWDWWRDLHASRHRASAD